MHPLPGTVWLKCSTASFTMYVSDQQVSEALQQEAKEQAAAAEAKAAALQVVPFAPCVPPPPHPGSSPWCVACLGPGAQPI